MNLDASEIAPGLYQGSLPEVGPAVADAGFRVLVLCARDYQRPSSDYPGVEVIHAPNDDVPVQPGPARLRALLRLAEQLAQRRRAYQKVLVTCYAGLNRSGLVTALTLHQLYGYSGIRCIDIVRARRPAALCNPAFVAALRCIREKEPS